MILIEATDRKGRLYVTTSTAPHTTFQPHTCDHAEVPGTCGLIDMEDLDCEIGGAAIINASVVGGRIGGWVSMVKEPGN